MEINVGPGERLASLLAGSALVAYGLARRSPLGIGTGLLGGALLYRGASGRCQVYRVLGRSTARPRPILVERSVTVNRTADDLYHFFRNLDNLPSILEHVEAVKVLDGGRSRWTVKGPAGTTVSWDADIIEDRPGEVIAWRALPGSEVRNEGHIRFERLPGARGTVVRVRLAYEPPAGRLGAAIARLLGEEPRIQLAEDLRHLKQVMETGEVPVAKLKNGHRPRPALA